MDLSVTIITLNEEQHIARAIGSVSFADEVIIVDSNSTDKTVEIAEKLGAKVVQNPFSGYGQQKNFAASLCQGKWILNIDADEEVSAELAKDIKQILSSQDAKDVYKINRLTQFCGRWIRHGGWYPHYLRRLCRKNKGVWTEPNVHEDLIPTDEGHEKCAIIHSHLLHYSFPTIASQIHTNIQYAQLGATDLVKRKGRRPNLFELCLRPIGKFFECFIWKRGFLDGKEGFIIAVNAAHSMFLKYSIAYLEEKT